jgi:ankyrin repeat protein
MIPVCPISHWAASGGHARVVELLLKSNADPWPKNLDDTTPLHFACAEGKYEVVTQLVATAGPVSLLLAKMLLVRDDVGCAAVRWMH